jgi:S1-C subfamily serine protease
MRRAWFLSVMPVLLAVPAPYVQAQEQRQRPDRAFLGILREDQSYEDGVRIVGVVPNGPADRAWMRSGDLILRIDNTPIHVMEDLTQTMARHKPGDSVTILIKRGPRERRLTATLTKWPVNQ